MKDYRICPPDPLYDGEASEEPLAWRVIESENGNVETADFGGHEISVLPESEVMTLDVLDLNEDSANGFIARVMGTLSGVKTLDEAELESLAERVKASPLYVSSKTATQDYLATLYGGEGIENLPPLERNAAIFMAAFLDQYLIRAITEQLAELKKREKVETRRTA